MDFRKVDGPPAVRRAKQKGRERRRRGKYELYRKLEEIGDWRLEIGESDKTARWRAKSWPGPAMRREESALSRL